VQIITGKKVLFIQIQVSRILVHKNREKRKERLADSLKGKNNIKSGRHHHTMPRVNALNRYQPQDSIPPFSIFLPNLFLFLLI
jgi:hypothetical protein